MTSPQASTTDPTRPTALADARRAVVGTIDELDVGAMRMVNVDGHRVCLIRTSEGVFALDQACPHEGYGLTTGQLDGGVVTCAWHNWKFRVSDGHCLLGEEDVRSHTVDVADDGLLTVELSRPEPAEERVRLTASLQRGIERQYVGQMARDVVRLLRADAHPGELIWEAVAYGAPRAEFGWGHSIASLTDCLGMIDRYGDDDRALPIVQAIAGVAESERGYPVQPLADPVTPTGDPRAAFRRAVETERMEDAQAIVRGALADGADAAALQPWFVDVISDHHLSYGHGAIYSQKAFQLLDRIGWDRADTVLPYLVPTLVYGTREDTLPYMRRFHRGVAELDLVALAEAANEPAPTWVDDGRLLSALLGPDRAEPALAAGAAIAAGASLDAVLDVVAIAVSERMLRYDTDGEFDFHDDFGWLDITHGLTYANAVRWHVARADRVTFDHVRLVLWTVFLAHWTGRHEWHTRVAPRAEIEPRSDDLVAYGDALQHDALLDGTTAFIVHAHAIKTSVAATEEAVRLGDPTPLDATARFLSAPKLERFVASTVTRSIDFLSGRVQRD